ncbi:MAG: hypothetical protein HYY64_15420 [Candidatus Rokubacteria bacterium]|nr:hypothetical protein [Candidatus Rokubacteria bacterium]
MKRLSALLSLPLLLGLLAAPVSAQPTEVVIGVIYPMSGANAQAGVDNKPVRTRSTSGSRACPGSRAPKSG